jgi:hypothetical protein
MRTPFITVEKVESRNIDSSGLGYRPPARPPLDTVFWPPWKGCFQALDTPIQAPLEPRILHTVGPLYRGIPL